MRIEQVIKKLNEHGLDTHDIAITTGAHEDTVRRWRRGAEPRPKYDDKLFRLLQVVNTLIERSPKLNIGFWLTGKNPFLNEERPFQMIAEGTDKPDEGWWSEKYPDSPYDEHLTSNVLLAAESHPEGTISLIQAFAEQESRRKLP